MPCVDRRLPVPGDLPGNRMDIGMDSILAEYHRELFAQYNFFAVDCSYGTEHGTTKLTEEHLLEYMNHNFSLEDIFLDKFLYRDFFALEAEKAEMTKAAFVTKWI